ncbi:AAA family ATPase [Nocardia sp. NPDC059240]|uniref:AAA family ATPase n=1 Tax=Nocardia sp. NPDC059240 TaxID=3346786 RepID=UPI003698CDFD
MFAIDPCCDTRRMPPQFTDTLPTPTTENSIDSTKLADRFHQAVEPYRARRRRRPGGHPRHGAQPGSRTSGFASAGDKPRVTKTERRYALAEELRAYSPRPRSARQPAARYEVTPCTIVRDIAALQQAGVPVVAVAGPGGSGVGSSMIRVGGPVQPLRAVRHDDSMDKLLVLVNGLPGSGKSTLGRSLAQSLNAQFLSKDAVKEALAACLDDAAGLRALGGIAMETVWALAQAISGTVVIDSWWFKPRDLHFARTGIRNSGASHAVEIWCDVPADIARARYVSRNRPAFYEDRQRLADNWDTWAAHAAPLELTATLVVDTSGPVDCSRLADQIRFTSNLRRGMK